MEMKYLKEQDTGQIYMPVVHVNGIVGLDASGTTTPAIHAYQIDYPAQGLSGFIEFKEYNKIVVANFEIDLSHDDLGDTSAFERLKNGNNVTFDIITDDSIDKYTFLTFDTVAYDDEGISYKIPTSAWYSPTKTFGFNAALRSNEYTIDNVGIIHSSYSYGSINKIIGTAVGIIIGGATNGG